jgi:predicted ATPase/predicted Ser/Thr protein kinase
LSSQLTINSRYRLDEKIGQGGVGTVYRGVDTRSGQEVAVKVLRPDVLKYDPDILTRFRREGDALRRLSHPNIVSILDTVVEDDRHCIVMEYVSGGSLQDVLKETPQLPIRRALEIALELSDALTRTHHLGIVHRDIKPGNVLMAPDGTPRLTDFSTAHSAQHESITETGMVLGTFAYLSPEVLDSKPVDARADIWSFGVLLYEMLAGRCPFEAGLPVSALITSILTAEVPPVQEFRPDTPSHLAELVHQMLDKDRERRLPSVRQIGAELEAILRGWVSKESTPVSSLAVRRPAREADVTTRHNLPTPGTTFVGRDDEIADICATLEMPECRLMTMQGPGGIGKTRLALAVAECQLGTYADGIYFVPLAPINSADLIVPAITDALEVNFGGQLELRVQLLDYLRSREMLLVLDNFEHLLDGVDFISQLLSEAPGIKLLVTSRQVLNIQEEWVRVVDGLSVPPSAEDPKLEDYGAIQLFVDRARRVRTNFSIKGVEPCVVRICQLVDGMPLGIELATSWLRMMDCQEIGDEIANNRDFLASNQRNIPERHRSLRAVFEYSWNLLDEGEKSALVQLSVFRGGFTRKAAQELSGARLPILLALMDKSLLRQAPGHRYDLHEIIRQYAQEKLTETSGLRVEALDRHSRYFMGYLHRRQQDAYGGKQREVMDDVEQEFENIRAAWKWSISQRHFDLLHEGCLVLYLYYRIRSRTMEGDKLFTWSVEELEPVAATSQQKRVFALVLASRAWFLSHRGKYVDASGLFKQSVDILREHGQEADLPFPLIFLSFTHTIAREFEHAEKLLDEVLDITRRHHDPANEAMGLYFAGINEQNRGNIDGAQEILQEGLAIARRVGNNENIADFLNNLGFLAINRFEYGLARRYLQESYENYEKIGDHFGCQRTSGGLGIVARHLGDYGEAEQHYQAALTYARMIGMQGTIANRLIQLGLVAVESEEYDRAEALYREALNLYEEMGNQLGKRWVLSLQGHIAHESGDYDTSLRLHEEALALSETLKTDDGVVYSHLGLCDVHLSCERTKKARQHLLLALQAVQKSRHDSMDIISLCRRLASYYLQTGQHERALQLVAIILNHPATLKIEKNITKGILKQLKSYLPEEQVRQVLNDEQTSDLEVLARTLEAELRATG